MTVPTCLSSRGEAGCGHPVNDHDGNQARDCCCCNWQHNDPQHVANCLECHIRRIKHQHGEYGRIASDELAAHLPQHLKEPFWERQIDRYFQQQLSEDYRQVTP